MVATWINKASREGHLTILFGDLNQLPAPCDAVLIRSAQTLHHRTRNIHSTLNYIENSQMIDLWRYLHPLLSCYTHEQSLGPDRIKSRIDLIYVSRELINFCKVSEIDGNRHGISSSHFPIWCVLDLNVYDFQQEKMRYHTHLVLDRKKISADDWIEYKNYLENNLIENYQALTIEESWMYLKRKILEASELFLKFKKLSHERYRPKLYHIQEERDVYTLAHIIHLLNQSRIDDYPRTLETSFRIAAKYSMSPPTTGCDARVLKTWLLNMKKIIKKNGIYIRQQEKTRRINQAVEQRNINFKEDMKSCLKSCLHREKTFVDLGDYFRNRNINEGKYEIDSYFSSLFTSNETQPGTPSDANDIQCAQKVRYLRLLF